MCALRYGGCAWETFGSTGSPLPGFPTCVQLPPLRPETEWGSSNFSVEFHHEKTNTQPSRNRSRRNVPRRLHRHPKTPRRRRTRAR
ncbi:hypothetical protein EYC95_22910 [Pseudomonas sp. BGI-2]|nr:hypothetical protein EYC95_22910 [Pseudomonas sp. BGI-2]